MKDVFIGIFAVLFALFIAPFLVFGVGALVGAFASITIGSWLVAGINTLFGTTLVAKDLPLVVGTIAFIGSFFHGNSRKSND